MKHLLLSVAILLSSAVNASPTSDAIKAACAKPEYQSAPECVKRAQKKEAMAQKREAKNAAILQSIIGK